MQKFPQLTPDEVLSTMQRAIGPRAGEHMPRAAGKGHTPTQTMVRLSDKRWRRVYLVEVRPGMLKPCVWYASQWRIVPPNTPPILGEKP